MTGQTTADKVKRQLSYGYFAIGYGASRVYCPDCRRAVTVEHRASKSPAEPLRRGLTEHLRDDCGVAS